MFFPGEWTKSGWVPVSYLWVCPARVFRVVWRGFGKGGRGRIFVRGLFRVPWGGTGWSWLCLSAFWRPRYQSTDCSIPEDCRWALFPWGFCRWGRLRWWSFSFRFWVWCGSWCSTIGCSFRVIWGSFREGCPPVRFPWHLTADDRVQ